METAQTTNHAASTVPAQQGAENYKKIAAHLESAARHHLEAAAHHEAGSHEKAAKSTLAAYGHLTIATQAQNEDARRFTSDK